MLSSGEPIRIKSDAKKYNNTMPSRIDLSIGHKPTPSCTGRPTGRPKPTWANWPANWRSPNKEEIMHSTDLGLDDIVSGVEGLQMSVVTKAASISPLVKGVTIGPNSLLKKDYARGDASSTVTPEKQLLAGEVSLSGNLSQQRDALANKVAPEYVNSKSEEKSRTAMKLMVELDKQRQDDVRKTIKARSYNYEKQARMWQEELESRQAALKLEAETRAQLERQQIVLQRREVELRELYQQEKLQNEHEQRVKERNRMIQKAEQRQEEERKKREEKNRNIATISQCQSDFVKRYQEILESVKSCKGKKELNDSCSRHFEMVKNLTHNIEELVNQCKLGEITSTELQKASVLVYEIKSYSQIIQEEVHNINKCIEDNALKKNATKAESTTSTPTSTKVLQEVQPSITTDNQTTTIKTDVSENVNEAAEKDAMNTYLSLLQILENFSNSYSDLLNDEKNRDFVFKCRKAVNIPVNSISDVSGAHLNDKVQKLISLLSGQMVDSGNVCVSASAHPQGVAFCMDLLAKKIVVQGTTVVSSKKETAFPIAAVIVQVWAQFPDFGTLLLGHFYKACPYLVPVSLPQVENQSDIDFYVSLGYSLDDSGKVEKQATYLKRMSGLMRLYAAILITKARGQHLAHPHGHKFAWCWLGRTLNMGPQPDLTATLLLDFLEITGSTISSTYGQQFQKVLHFICTEYFPLMKKMGSSGGPVTRLEVFLEKALKDGRIHPPSGMLPSNFW